MRRFVTGLLLAAVLGALGCGGDDGTTTQAAATTAPTTIDTGAAEAAAVAYARTREQTAQAGLVEASQVFVEQAKEAGIKIKLRSLDIDGYFARFLEWPFSVDYWDVSPYYAQVALNQLPTAPFNATKFANKEFVALWNKGVSQTNSDDRKATAQRMQEAASTFMRLAQRGQAGD